MKNPDVCGYTLGNARQQLEEKGFLIDKVNILKPPKDACEEYDDNYRIVKIKFLNESNIEVLVCKPLY